MQAAFKETGASLERARDVLRLCYAADEVWAAAVLVRASQEWQSCATADQRLACARWALSRTSAPGRTRTESGDAI